MKSQFQNKQTHHEIKTATDKFLQRVSDGITYLIERHGYSRERASNLILGEIRKNQRLPSDDEVGYIIYCISYMLSGFGIIVWRLK